MTLSELKETAEYVRSCIENNPERRMDICEEYIQRNEKRPFPCLFLNIGPDPAERKPLHTDDSGKSAEERLRDNLMSMLAPMRLNNPIAPSSWLAWGPAV